MNNNSPKVSIIILNWNGWKDTINCLESLYQIDYPNYNIILLDNNSKDDSIQRIMEYSKGKIKPKTPFYEYNPKNKPLTIFEYTNEETEPISQLNNLESYGNLSSDKKIILIKNNRNYGFAEGNNIGIRYCLKTLNPQYILLLNNDTVVKKNFLTEMIKTGENDDKIAVIGSKTYYYNFNGRDDVLWSVGGIVDLSKYPGYHDIDINNKKIQTKSSMEVDWISGAVLLIKTKMLPYTLLNSEFFFGCEDVDLCIEMKNKGYKMVTNLEAVVWHKTGVSRNKIKFRGILKEIRTNLKFMKIHKKNYKLHLPLYIIQIIYRYSSMFIKKILRNTKNSLG